MMSFGRPFEWNHPETWPWMFYVWIAFAVIGFVPNLWRWFQRRRASSWSTTQGSIESVEITKPHFSFLTRRGHHVARLGYSYSVDGSAHGGDYKRDFQSKREAQEFVRDLKGKPTAVRFYPRQPSTSLLLETDIEILQKNRAPLSDEEAQLTESIPEWATPFVWLFASLSAVGLCLSLWIHIGALTGRRVAPAAFFWALHVGIFVVWLPAIFVAKQTIGSVDRKDFWKVALKGCPDWMRHVVYGFFVYAGVNFLLFIRSDPTSGGGADPPAAVWRGFSGHWMCSILPHLQFSTLPLKRLAQAHDVHMDIWHRRVRCIAHGAVNLYAEFVRTATIAQLGTTRVRTIFKTGGPALQTNSLARVDISISEISPVLREMEFFNSHRRFHQLTSR